MESIIPWNIFLVVFFNRTRSIYRKFDNHNRRVALRYDFQKSFFFLLSKIVAGNATIRPSTKTWRIPTSTNTFIHTKATTLLDTHGKILA